VTADIADAVTAYRNVARRKVVVVPNGIDTAAFETAGDGESIRLALGIPRDVPIIGTIGRLDEVKRQDLLIRGFANIAHHDPKPHLLLVGDGPELQTLQQLANALGLSDRVHFAGYQSRPAHFLHLMDIFVLTSRMEGMPLAILEAFAAGCPVIASRVGGVPRMIEHGVSGLLYNFGDGVALSEAIRCLLANPADAIRLGDVGREYVRARFDLNVMGDTYEQHYRELLRKKLALT
jgi:glycosyltransferase involved in cell wall biosynthesis